MQLGTNVSGSNSFSNWAASLFTYLSVPISTTYDFYLAADNGAMAYIENVLVLNTSKLNGNHVLSDCSTQSVVDSVA